MIIAIAGASGSGKTTLARAFVEQLSGAVLLSTDSYYRDLSHLSPAERAAVNFDHPDAVDWATLLAHLAELSAGRRVRVPRYDFKTHIRRRDSLISGPAESTVLEGIFSLWHPAVRELIDVAVFVDTSDDLCLERRTTRDVAERGRTERSVHLQWERDTLPMFREHISPTREHAHHIVDGTTPPERHVRRILNLDEPSAT